MKKLFLMVLLLAGAATAAAQVSGSALIVAPSGQADRTNVQFVGVVQAGSFVGSGTGLTGIAGGTAGLTQTVELLGLRSGANTSLWWQTGDTLNLTAPGFGYLMSIDAGSSNIEVNSTLPANQTAYSVLNRAAGDGRWSQLSSLGALAWSNAVDWSSIANAPALGSLAASNSLPFLSITARPGAWSGTNMIIVGTTNTNYTVVVSGLVASNWTAGPESSSPPPPFDPTNDSRLVVWLDGASGRLVDSGSVTGWVDRVAGHLYWTPGTGTAPADSANGPDFDGVDDYLVIESGNPTAGSDSISVFVAATHHAPDYDGESRLTTDGFSYYETADVAGWWEIQGTPDCYGGVGRAARFGPEALTIFAGWDIGGDDFRVLSQESSGDGWKYFVRGVEALSYTANFDDGASGFHSVGANFYSGAVSGGYAHAQIHEVLVYTNVFSSGDRESIQSYLSNRWSP